MVGIERVIGNCLGNFKNNIVLLIIDNGVDDIKKFTFSKINTSLILRRSFFGMVKYDNTQYFFLALRQVHKFRKVVL